MSAGENSESNLRGLTAKLETNITEDKTDVKTSLVGLLCQNFGKDSSGVFQEALRTFTDVISLR